MDITRIIHDGDATLHRGSVDRGSQPTIVPPESVPEPVLETPSEPDTEKPEPKQAETKEPSVEPKEVNKPKQIPTGPRGDSRRPRRQPPPTFARVWNGQRNKINDNSLSDSRPDIAVLSVSGRSRPVARAEPPTAPAAATSSGLKKLGPGGGESLTGLPPSLTGKLPISEMAHYVANWVFQKLSEIKDASIRTHIELEVKFGQIIDSFSHKRVSLPVDTETILNAADFRKHGYTFASEIDAGTFKRLEDALNALDTGAGDDAIKRSHVLHRDETFKVKGQRNIRVTTSDSGEVVEAISKVRIDNLHIYSPSYPTDLRVSLSIEHPAEAKEAQQGDRVSVRNKNRLTWAASGAKVDLTAVNTERASDGSVVSSTKEAEVEANGSMLVSCYEEYMRNKSNGVAMDKFLEVVQYTLNTCSTLRRATMPKF